VNLGRNQPVPLSSRRSWCRLAPLLFQHTLYTGTVSLVSETHGRDESRKPFHIPDFVLWIFLTFHSILLHFQSNFGVLSCKTRRMKINPAQRKINFTIEKVLGWNRIPPWLRYVHSNNWCVVCINVKWVFSSFFPFFLWLSVSWENPTQNKERNTSFQP